MSDGMPHIGKNIRTLRAHRGLSQQQLADKTGLTRQTIFTIEHGGGTTTKTLNAIASALGVSSEKLVSKNLISIDGD